MPAAWTGPDPTEAVDPGDYELGTEQVANEDITITHVRVWAGPGELGYAGRAGRIWSTAGALLASVSMPTTLTPGWTTHELSSPVERLAGQRWKVSYSTGGNYGVAAGALTSGVDSADGAVTTLAAGDATAGNGTYNETPGNYPNLTFGQPFYGVDAVYELGIASGTAPTITGLALAADGLAVTAVVTATDPDGLSGATFFVDWGDGQTSTGSSATLTHTYAAGGIYAVLARVTDSTGLSGYRAGAIEVTAPSVGLPTQDIIDALVSHAARLGRLERVNGHEPKSAPGRGLSAAIWADRIAAVPATSGLRTTSALVVMNVRLYSNMLQEPQDAIDPNLVACADELMAAYSGDFELGGLVQAVDLLGRTGTALAAQAGYISQDNRLYRVITITVPLIINDAWEQVP
jgi:hypothetical protein